MNDKHQPIDSLCNLAHQHAQFDKLAHEHHRKPVLGLLRRRRSKGADITVIPNIVLIKLGSGEACIAVVHIDHERQAERQRIPAITHDARRPETASELNVGLHRLCTM
jgi:hypothetical protein